MRHDDRPGNVDGRDDPEEWVVREWEGDEIPVRAGGFLDNMISGPDDNSYEKQLERGTMSWSLGDLGDILWMMVPELRPVISELAREEFEKAITYNRYLHELSRAELCDAVSAILLRSLRDLPVWRDTAVRCLTAMRRVIKDTGDDYRDTFANEIMNPVTFAGLWPALAELDPELIDVMRERPEWRGALEFCENFGHRQ
ncbi:hypothetical protein [Allokutzneria oryzae]|uniref:HEAT repeat domain-containing protein n=1 Tax=Allokutzneria oryzae TaxID=1378989 RepID=A0ABV6A3S5_9PSEU